LASADAELCQRLRESLGSLRWRSHTAGGGAAALALIEEVRPQALILDGWLPDLKPEEVAKYVLRLHPELEVVYLDGSAEPGSAKGPHRAELQQVVREAAGEKAARAGAVRDEVRSRGADALLAAPRAEKREGEISTAPGSLMRAALRPAVEFLPEMIGGSEPMRELARMIRLVAPRSTTVLIEGETGTGKEVVAKAVHRLSSRVNKPLVVMNCAAIPEALLEAELFGHTRGAFTGAVQSRTGRVEAADGGTLFLDEIGEMPIALQAKMLRFLECGELQRVGDNQPTYVDVRVIAATHQPLEQRAEERLFRLDLYHRLSVFPIEVPALRSRMEDLPALTEHFLAILGRTAPRKRLSAAAMECLKQHRWPGNVRELMHVLERAVILAGDGVEIGEAEIRLRRRERPASSQMQLYP
jgi:transcriptional regulator with GAF, ATPase, and Fis domain